MTTLFLHFLWQDRRWSQRSSLKARRCGAQPLLSGLFPSFPFPFLSINLSHVLSFPWRAHSPKTIPTGSCLLTQCWGSTQINSETD
ncbi:hypothetical protein SRHO_G00295450 [Serrasalmus rhombeus]